MSQTLVARMDNDGDVLLAGPAVRAVAAARGPVLLLCGPRGHAAAELLPGVREIVQWTVPWIDPEPGPVSVEGTLGLVSLLRNRVNQAIILTSFHQSPLPLALLLRMAGVERIAAISEDYPGSLLDVRHQAGEGLHEVERSLELVGRLGISLPAGDDRALRVLRPAAGRQRIPAGPYVVVHPGSSVPARSLRQEAWTAVASALTSAGRRVVVTGADSERALATAVAGPAGAVNLAGRTDLGELAEVLAGAVAVVVGNTGPAHLAAAVGTPVVSIFAPTVPAERWRPWAVPHVLLGDQDVACAGCRAPVCPIAGQPCLSGIRPADVVAAVEQMTGATQLRAVAM